MPLPQFDLTQEACIPGKAKRRPKARIPGLRQRIIELSKQNKTPPEIGRILGLSKQAVYPHIRAALKDGELNSNETSYIRAGPTEERKWYKIMEATLRELPFYERQGLVSSARKMGYRLIELNEMLKKDFAGYYRYSAEARRGIDYTNTRLSKLPKLPIDCFRDDVRTTIGDTDMDYQGSDPTPARPPEDPEEYIDYEIETFEDAIQDLKNAPNNYDGSCKGGSKGVNCGKLYNQPNYFEIWCESDATQQDLEKYQGDLKVKVAAMRGQFSTPFMVQCVKRLIKVAKEHPCIKKIIILYFGDSDKAGNDIRNKVKTALDWYQGGSLDLCIPVPVELRHIMITPDQVKQYKLKGFQLEAFMTTEKRLASFKKIEQDAIKECWDEDIWIKNCPDEEYDYEAHEEEKPEPIDIDDSYEGEEETHGEMMQRKIAEALPDIRRELESF